MEILKLPLTFHAYQIASLYASDTQLRKVLKEPHYIETDSTRTFGGNESLWAYEISSEKFALVCRIPYDETVIYTEMPDTKYVLPKIEELFPNLTLDIYEKVFQI